MKVVFLPLAESDLTSLSSYIQQELHNLIAARNIVVKILNLSQKLVSFPDIGTSLEKFDTRLAEYRYLLADNYIIIYKITSKEVQIIRVLYARSDYVRLLGT